MTGAAAGGGAGLWWQAGEAGCRDHQSSINLEYIPELESEVQIRSREEIR